MCPVKKCHSWINFVPDSDSTNIGRKKICQSQVSESRLLSEKFSLYDFENPVHFRPNLKLQFCKSKWPWITKFKWRNVSKIQFYCHRVLTPISTSGIGPSGVCALLLGNCNWISKTRVHSLNPPTPPQTCALNNIWGVWLWAKQRVKNAHCAEPWARNPIGGSGIFVCTFHLLI